MEPDPDRWSRPTRREFVKKTGLAGVAGLAGLPVVRRGEREADPHPGKTVEPEDPTQEAGALHAIETPVLEIGYEEWGDPEGFPVILLHGFPYDVRAWDGVAPTLAGEGHRVLAPYLRGFGPTRFLDPEQPRMAEQAAIARDVVDFADALGLERFALAGFDWGNRAACITSILHPERVSAQVAVNGYSVQDTVNPSGPAPARFEALLWYQWYFNTDRGRQGLEENRRDICRYLWESWAPAWDFSDERFERTAVSFDNPDFVDVVIHSYRHRHGNAPGEERFLEVERRLAEQPPVPVPAIVLRGTDSGFGPPPRDPSGDRARFSSLVDRRIVEGGAHDLPQQRPDAVSSALLELLRG